MDSPLQELAKRLMRARVSWTFYFESAQLLLSRGMHREDPYMAELKAKGFELENEITILEKKIKIIELGEKIGKV